MLMVVLLRKPTVGLLTLHVIPPLSVSSVDFIPHAKLLLLLTSFYRVQYCFVDFIVCHYLDVTTLEELLALQMYQGPACSMLAKCISVN